jgi:hypothetical protein
MTDQFKSELSEKINKEPEAKASVFDSKSRR